MDQFLNFILENIPALSAVATVIAGFISVVAKLKDNNKEVSAEIKKTLDSQKETIEQQKELAEQNEKLNETNAELIKKLTELKTLVDEVVNLKAEVEDLNDTNTKLASTVKASVKYEIEKEKQTIANLENDKKRLGGM